MGTHSNIVFEVVVDGVRVTYVAFYRHYDGFFNACGFDLAVFIMRHSDVTSVVELASRFMVEKCGPNGSAMASFVAAKHQDNISRDLVAADLVGLWQLEVKALAAAPNAKEINYRDIDYQLTEAVAFPSFEFGYRVTERPSESGRSAIEISAWGWLEDEEVDLDNSGQRIYADMNIEQFACLAEIGRGAPMLKPPYPPTPTIASELATAAAWWRGRWRLRLEALVLSATRRSTTLQVGGWVAASVVPQAHMTTAKL